MTVTQNASRDDILLMEDFLDCAKIEFDAIPAAGVAVSVVDEMFSKYVGYAAEDWPTNVLVAVVVGGLSEGCELVTLVG
jgi:hypothetical protein